MDRTIDRKASKMRRSEEIEDTAVVMLIAVRSGIVKSDIHHSYPNPAPTNLVL